MDLGFLVARLTLVLGVLLVIRLIPESVVVLGEGPHGIYFVIVLADVLIASMLAVTGWGLIRRHPWACPGAMGAWGALAANSVILFIVWLPVLQRYGSDFSKQFLILAIREMIYALTVLLSPAACWILWTRRERVPSVANPLGYWLLFGLLSGGGLAGLVVVLR